MFVSILEIKGLILPEEQNRKVITKKSIDPVVEVRLETFSNRMIREQRSNPLGKPKRHLVFTSHQNKDVADQYGDFTVNLDTVNHSGKLPNKKQGQDNFASQNSLYKQESEKFIHILVRDNNQPGPDGKGLELGSAKIIIDELIDTNLKDLAKQFCVCLERSHILQQMIDSGKYPKNIELFTQFSGIVKF